MTLTRFFKCLSDETRLRCLILLYRQGELCVCELTQALDLAQPKISRHLAQLRQCGLLNDERRGQWVYYKINPELPDWANKVLELSAEAFEKEERYQMDQQRLSSMTNRPADTICC